MWIKPLSMCVTSLESIYVMTLGANPRDAAAHLSHRIFAGSDDFWSVPLSSSSSLSRARYDNNIIVIIITLQYLL